MVRRKFKFGNEVIKSNIQRFLKGRLSTLKHRMVTIYFNIISMIGKVPVGRET